MATGNGRHITGCIKDTSLLQTLQRDTAVSVIQRSTVCVLRVKEHSLPVFVSLYELFPWKGRGSTGLNRHY